MIIVANFIALLQPEWHEIAAHLELIVNVLVYILMSEELEHFLLILLDLIDDGDQEDQRYDERATRSDQEVEENLHVWLATGLGLIDDGVGRVVQGLQHWVEAIVHHEIDRGLAVINGRESQRRDTESTHYDLHDGLPHWEQVLAGHVGVWLVYEGHIDWIDLLKLVCRKEGSLQTQICLSIFKVRGALPHICNRSIEQPIDIVLSAVTNSEIVQIQQCECPRVVRNINNVAQSLLRIVYVRDVLVYIGKERYLYHIVDD